MAIEKVALDLELSEIAKEKILKRGKTTGLKNPIPDLMWAKWDNECEYNWQIGFHEKDKIQEGWFFDVSGVTFYTCQDWLFEQLEGKTLDIVDNKLVVRESD